MSDSAAQQGAVIGRSVAGGGTVGRGLRLRGKVSRSLTAPGGAWRGGCGAPLPRAWALGRKGAWPGVCRECEGRGRGRLAWAVARWRRPAACNSTPVPAPLRWSLPRRPRMLPGLATLCLRCCLPPQGPFLPWWTRRTRRSLAEHRTPWFRSARGGARARGARASSHEPPPRAPGRAWPGTRSPSTASTPQWRLWTLLTP